MKAGDAVCLKAQGIDNNDGGVGGGRRAQGFSKNYRGISGGRVIYNASEGLEKMTEAARIQGQRRRLPRCNDRPEVLETTTEA